MFSILPKAINYSQKKAQKVNFSKQMFTTSCLLLQLIGEGASPASSSQKKYNNILVNSSTFQATNTLSTLISIDSSSEVKQLQLNLIYKKLLLFMFYYTFYFYSSKKWLLLTNFWCLLVSFTIHSCRENFISLFMSTWQVKIAFLNRQSKNYYSFSSNNRIVSLFIKKVMLSLVEGACSIFYSYSFYSLELLEFNQIFFSIVFLAERKTDYLSYIDLQESLRRVEGAIVASILLSLRLIR